MATIKEYYANARKVEAEITEEFVYVIPVEAPAGDKGIGQMAEVNREMAGKFIGGDRTHRLAKPEEVKAFLENREQHKKAIRAAQSNTLANFITGRLDGSVDADKALAQQAVEKNKQGNQKTGDQKT